MTTKEKIARANILKKEVAEREAELSGLESEIAAEVDDPVRDYLKQTNENAAARFNPLVRS